MYIAQLVDAAEALAAKPERQQLLPWLVRDAEHRGLDPKSIATIYAGLLPQRLAPARDDLRWLMQHSPLEELVHDGAMLRSSRGSRADVLIKGVFYDAAPGLYRPDLTGHRPVQAIVLANLPSVVAEDYTQTISRSTMDVCWLDPRALQPAYDLGGGAWVRQYQWDICAGVAPVGAAIEIVRDHNGLISRHQSCVKIEIPRLGSPTRYARIPLCEPPHARNSYLEALAAAARIDRRGPSGVCKVPGKKTVQRYIADHLHVLDLDPSLLTQLYRYFRTWL